MNANASDVAAVVACIRRYLREHPNAADTLEGVAAWWLSNETSGEQLTTVERAMEVLLAGREVTRRALSDGTVIYERTKADHGKPSQNG